MIAGVHGVFGLGDALTSRGDYRRAEDLLFVDPTLAILVEAELQRLMAEARRLVAIYEVAIRALADTLLRVRIANQRDVDAALNLVPEGRVARIWTAITKKVAT